MLDKIRNPLPLAARGLPESELIPDADAARAVKGRLQRPRRFELSAMGIVAWTPFLVAIGIITLIACNLVLGRYTTGLHWTLRMLVEMLLPFLIVAVIGIWIQRHIAGLAVREVLLERGIPVCVGCGYDLSLVPATEPRCPECGRVRTDPAFNATNNTDSSDQRTIHSERSDNHTV